MIAAAAAIAAGLALVLCLVRLFAGPTLYDRALAVNAVLTKVALICAACAALTGRTAPADAAIALVLSMLIVNVAVFKVFKTRSFQAPLVRGGEL